MRVPFFSRAPKTFAIADVGAGGSAVGFVQVPRSGPARIVATHRSFSPVEERTAEGAVTALGTTFSESAASALAQYSKGGGKGSPEAVYVVVHAPWAESHSFSNEQHFEKDTKITADMIGTLAKSALAQAGDIPRDQILEASVVHVELNGYPVTNPVGRMAQQVKVAVLLSTMQKPYRDALEHAVQAAFPSTPLKLRSHARALVSLLRERHDEARNCVIVDVADEGTVFSVIRKNLLDGQAQIPAGTHALLTRIAPAGSREETLGLLSMLEKGTCSTAACDAITQALTAAEPEITKIFGEGLASLAAKRRLPNDAILVTHADIAPWFSHFLSRIDFAQFTSTSQPLSVKILTPDALKMSAETAPGVTEDVPLSIVATLVHNESGSAD